MSLASSLKLRVPLIFSIYIPDDFDTFTAKEHFLKQK